MTQGHGIDSFEWASRTMRENFQKRSRWVPIYISVPNGVIVTKQLGIKGMELKMIGY
jgi:hypothetical protein